MVPRVPEKPMAPIIALTGSRTGEASSSGVLDHLVSLMVSAERGLRRTVDARLKGMAVAEDRKVGCSVCVSSVRVEPLHPG